LTFFNRNQPKTNLLTRAHQKGPYFSETIFCRVFWDISLILAEARQKKFILFSGFAKLYTPSTLNIQMKLILLWVWAERAVLGRAKTALKFKYEI